jgi:hypothetical protein
MKAMQTARLLSVTVLACLSLAAGSALGASPEKRSVQVRKADLRPTPSYLAKPSGALAYGDRVTVLEQKEGWFRVSLDGAEPGAWVNGSALTKKTIVLKAGDAAQTAASSGELALAGQGFNSDVEAKFRADHKDIDFKWVDRMEKRRVTPEQSRDFLKDGGLGTLEKGGKP